MISVQSQMQSDKNLKKCYQLIETEWHIYASLSQAIIGSDNGLSPDRHQAII